MEEKQSIKELVKIELKDCRFHADCLALKVKQFRKYDTFLNSFLAISSSASIASWAINSDLAMLCGIIIAVSQVITALKPVFPFGKYVHTLNTRCYKHEALFLEIGNLWYNLLDGLISEETAKMQLDHLKKRISENVFFDDDDNFEFSEDIQEKARYMTTDTLKIKFNITD